MRLLMRKAPVVLVALWMLMRGTTSAGPPYETDDPVPTDYRNYEIYLYGDYRHRSDTNGGTVDAEPIALEINYGLMRNVQFSVALPTAYTRGFDDAGTPATSQGTGDFEVGAKYRFLQETDTRPQISFYPSVTFASGSVHEDPAEAHGTLFLPVWAQKSSGKWTFFGGGGATFDWDGSSRLSWTAGIAGTYDITDATNIGLEFNRTTPHTDTPNGVTDIGFGLIHTLGKIHAILFSFGRSLTPGTFHGYAAYEWNLGPPRTKPGW